MKQFTTAMIASLFALGCNPLSLKDSKTQSKESEVRELDEAEPLPGYMLASEFVHIERTPTTINVSIDGQGVTAPSDRITAQVFRLPEDGSSAEVVRETIQVSESLSFTGVAIGASETSAFCISHTGLTQPVEPEQSIDSGPCIIILTDNTTKTYTTEIHNQTLAGAQPTSPKSIVTEAEDVILPKNTGEVEEVGEAEDPLTIGLVMTLSTTAAAVLEVGGEIEIEATFNQDIEAIGTPGLRLSWNGQRRLAQLKNQVNATTLVFSYPLTEQDISLGSTAISFESSGITTTLGNVLVAGEAISDYTLTADNTGSPGVTPPGLKVWLDGASMPTIFKDQSCGEPTTLGDTVGCWQARNNPSLQFKGATVAQRQFLLPNLAGTKDRPFISMSNSCLDSQVSNIGVGNQGTIIVVYRKRAGQAYQRLFGSYDFDPNVESGSWALLHGEDNSSLSLLIQADSTWERLHQGPAAPIEDNVWQVATGFIGTQTTSIFLDTTLSAELPRAQDRIVSPTASDLGATFMVGCGGKTGDRYQNELEGDVAEILVFDEVLSTEMHQRLLKDLKGKWGL